MFQFVKFNRDTEYVDANFIRTPRHTQALSFHPADDVYDPNASFSYEYQGTVALPPQQQQAHTEVSTMQMPNVDRDLLLAIQLQDEEDDRSAQRTRTTKPVVNSFWNGNSDASTTQPSKAQILQHRALAQASQNIALRRPHAQGGGSGLDNNNSNRRTASVPSEEESTSPCLIC